MAGSSAAKIVATALMSVAAAISKNTAMTMVFVATATAAEISAAMDVLLYLLCCPSTKKAASRAVFVGFSAANSAKRGHAATVTKIACAVAIRAARMARTCTRSALCASVALTATRAAQMATQAKKSASATKKYAMALIACNYAVKVSHQSMQFVRRLLLRCRVCIAAKCAEQAAAEVAKQVRSAKTMCGIAARKGAQRAAAYAAIAATEVWWLMIATVVRSSLKIILKLLKYVMPD
jgi:hypothetical protein